MDIQQRAARARKRALAAAKHVEVRWLSVASPHRGSSSTAVTLNRLSQMESTVLPPCSTGAVARELGYIYPGCRQSENVRYPRRLKSQVIRTVQYVQLIATYRNGVRIPQATYLDLYRGSTLDPVLLYRTGTQ